MGSVTHSEPFKADGSRSQRTSCKAPFLDSASSVDQVPSISKHSCFSCHPWLVFPARGPLYVFHLFATLVRRGFTSVICTLNTLL